MNTTNNLSVSDAGSMILGAGLTQITTDLKVALMLVGVGVLLKILVALLNKKGIEVSSHEQG